METDEDMLPPGVDDSAPPGDAADRDAEDAASKQLQQQQQQSQVPLSETLVELLNQTSLMQSSHRQSTTQRLANLKKVQDIILHKDPTLLDSFSEEISAYQHDNAPEIRRFVVAFLESAALQDNDFVQRTMYNLGVMMQDDNVIVVSRCILALLKLFVHILHLLVNVKGGMISEAHEQMWAWNIKLRNEVLPMLESENDGLRSHTIKYYEFMTLSLSEKPKDSEYSSSSSSSKDSKKDDKRGLSFSAELIPDNHKILKRADLEEEGKEAMDTLMEFMARPDISAANLMTCLASFTNIAKERPSFTSRIVQGL